MIATEIEKHKILFLNFNQDSSCICVGTEDGFIIYYINPFQELVHRSKYFFIMIFN
jgi:hypothetical protein